MDLKQKRGEKIMKPVSDMIEEKIKLLDPEPQLKIKRVSALPIINKWVILADGKSNRPKNPTIYIINESREYDGISGGGYQEIFASMVASIAIRKRLQAGDKKPQPFLYVSSMKEEKEFWKIATPLWMQTYDEFEFDAEIIGRIVGRLFWERKPIEDIKKILTIDASKIIEKLGMKFITESMYL